MAIRNFLVTGGTGLIGSHVVDELLDREYYVRSTYFSSEPRENPYVEYVQGDLRREEDCLAVCKDVDYVFMCAAVTSGAHDMVNNPLVHVTDNIVMNTRMLSAAYQQGVKVFNFISSSSVYPDMRSTPCKESMAWEGVPHDSYWWVAWMKKMAEILCIGYATRLDRKMKACIIRPSNAYGPRDKFDPLRSHFIANKIREIVEGTDPLVVWGDGNDWRDYIHAKDLARGIVSASEFTDDHPKVEYTDFNIASGDAYSTKEIVETLCYVAGVNPAIVYDESKPTTIKARLLDISRARDILGFKPKVDIEQGLYDTLMWYKSQREAPIAQNDEKCDIEKGENR